MSDELRDRMLEAGLERLFAEEAQVQVQSEELARRVRARLEAGDRGTDLSNLTQPNTTGLRVPPQRTGFGWERMALVAALLAALASILPRLVVNESSVPTAPAVVVATANRPLPVIGGEARAELRAGDVVALAANDSPAEVTAGGVVFEVSPGSLFSMVDAATLELGLGQVTRTGLIEPGLGPAVLAGGLTVEPWASITGSLVVESVEPVALAQLASHWEERGAWERDLFLQVGQGYVFLHYGDEDEEIMDGHGRRFLIGEGTPEPTDDAERLSVLLEQIEKMTEALPTGLPQRLSWEEMWNEMWYARDQFSNLLAARPERWDLISPEILAAFDAPYRNRALSWVLLSLVTRDRSELAAELARELWSLQPDDFAMDHILALAERGLFEFERELQAMFEFHEEEADRLLPAGYLALRGDEDALNYLMTVPRGIALDKADLESARAAAAVVCARLGRGDPWQALLDEGQELVPEWLDTGRVDLARAFVVNTMFFADLLHQEEPLELAFLSQRMAAHRQQHRKALIADVEILQAYFEAVDR